MPRAQLIGQSRRPRHRLRFLRAIWHDSMALWREFRRPIVVFVLVTLLGGYLYGELYFLARGEVIALIDRPYIMLQLMILETPESAPEEWYLVAFWYILPIIFVFIVGNGVVDFVRLFFNRDERRSAWREALASTYRNHIIVFGAGHVGLRVVRTLYSMGIDVVVIDNDPDLGVDEALREMNVPLINADGRLNSTLEKASIQYAEAFIACTGNDHVNLEAIMKVRELNSHIHLVARVWDDHFGRQIERIIQDVRPISSSNLSAPVFAASALGVELTQTLRVGKIDYSMVRMSVNAGSFMIGQSVGDLQKQNDMDIVLHCVNDQVEVQPSRTTILQEGDTVVIFAQHDRILDVVARNRRQNNHRR